MTFVQIRLDFVILIKVILVNRQIYSIYQSWVVQKLPSFNSVQAAIEYTLSVTQHSSVLCTFTRFNLLINLAIVSLAGLDLSEGDTGLACKRMVSNPILREVVEG